MENIFGGSAGRMHYCIFYAETGEVYMDLLNNNLENSNVKVGFTTPPTTPLPTHTHTKQVGLYGKSIEPIQDSWVYVCLRDEVGGCTKWLQPVV